MKASRLVCLWWLVVVATTLPAGEYEVCDPAAAGFDADKLAMILPAMQRHIEEGKLVGGLGLVARGDQIIFAETWGQRDRDKQLPMTDGTIFRIYSIRRPRIGRGRFSRAQAPGQATG